MRWLVAALMVGHGLVHCMGFAKAFGLADFPGLTEPIPRGFGLLWLLAGLLVGGAGLLHLTAPRAWWIAGFAAVIVSQAVIVTAWGDARFGTVANLIILALAAHGFASEGPLSLRAEYRRQVESRLTESRVGPVLTEADIAGLPMPVRRYLRVTGSVGQPRPTWFSAEFRGRIRGTADDAWMDFTAEQNSFLDEPARFFLMDAKRGGLPVDVLHMFQAREASMRVRLLSMVPLVEASGADMTRAETVTLLNDLALFAPGALVDSAIEWEVIDERSVRARYTLGSNTVGATLHFNDAGELVDFVSEDRLAASPDGSSFIRQRWSTPVHDYKSFGSRRVASRGTGWWHPQGRDFPYIELEVIALGINASAAGDPDNPGR